MRKKSEKIPYKFAMILAYINSPQNLILKLAAKAIT
jgi:hypothetical protein